MSFEARIVDAGAARTLGADEFPLALGGADAAVPLPASTRDDRATAGPPLAWLGLAEGHVYVQPAEGGPPVLRNGAPVMLRTEQGMVHGTVKKVGRTVVDVDMNHPYAGQNLAFRIEVIEVREAEAEEIAHGHVHGPGGHAHD